MIEVNIKQVQNQFIDLLYKLESGEEIIIEDSGKQVAKIVPIPNKKSKRILGQEKGKIKISNDFNAPLSEIILKDFYK